MIRFDLEKRYNLKRLEELGYLVGMQVFLKQDIEKKELLCHFSQVKQ